MVSGYSEKHHIIPRSLGGSDDKNNIIRLPIKAHYICHHLLIYMLTDGNRIKMIHAFWRMCNTNTQKQKITASSYERLKIAKIEVMKMTGNHWIGKKHKKSSIEKMKISASGRNPHLYENYKLPKSWNIGLKKETNEILNKISKNMQGDKNPMYGRTGAEHPNSKKFSLLNSYGEQLEIFNTRLEFSNYCKKHSMPFKGIYNSLKTNLPYIDGSKNGRFVLFNGYCLVYI